MILNDSTTAYYYSIFYSEFKGKIEMNSSLLEFDYNDKRVRIYRWKYGDLASAFILRDCNFLNVKDKVVVYIGASIAGTPNYSV